MNKPQAAGRGALRRSIGSPIVSLVTAGMVFAAASHDAQAARVASVSPQGEVALVRQLVVRFDAPVVAFGDPRLPEPYGVLCNGAPMAGNGRWLSASEWVFDFTPPPGPGMRCTARPKAGWQPLQGTLEGSTEFSFSTGGPAVERIEPWAGSTIEEDQHFVLRLSGAATPASVKANAWCEVDGLGERIALAVVEGAPRDQVLAARRIGAAAAARALLVACSRALPAQAKVRIVWGAGIAAAANPRVLTRAPQAFGFRVRKAFAAEFSCERENAQSPCMPLRPLVLRFSAPVARSVAEAVRLQPAQGPQRLPRIEGESAEVSELGFPAPLSENASLRVVLPAGVTDAAGRALANAGSFPLAVTTGAMPPLAKFAAGPFGIVEAGPDAFVPLTLRHVQADLLPAGAAAAGVVRIKRIDEAQWLPWLGRVARHHEASIPAREAGVAGAGRDAMIATRELSLLAGETDARRIELPQLQAGDARATEVIGIPIGEPGYHVLEVQSPTLGRRLLDKDAPLFVRTGVLVTNLGVHFKYGRESSVVWVTTLDRAAPVASAQVRVHDCAGQPLWEGITDSSGLARIDKALPEAGEDTRCTWQRGFFVTASAERRGADGSARRDAAFVFSSWSRGIEPWRFGLPVGYEGDMQAGPKLRAHTVFDRTLLRAGETVSMKHLVRAEHQGGLRDLGAERLPVEMKVVHVGSGEEQSQPIRFDSAGRAALASWNIPATAKLGAYEVKLRSGGRDFTSGQFRVEEFRLPLVDARLSGPSAPQVAPQELALSVQLTHLSGGGLAHASAGASALLRDRDLAFAAYARYSFEPPRAADANARTAGDDSDAPRSDGAKLVVDKQAFTTDANGAARVLLKGLPKITRASELQAEVTFSDPNGELQTAAARIALWPASRVVGVRTGSWGARAGKVKFQAVLLDLQGQPIAGGKVAVVARQTQWRATRKRIVGGLYAYDQQAVQKDLGTLCEGSTDARGLLLCEAGLDAAGQVELIARAADEAGRISEAATSLWVSAHGETWFEQDNDDRIDVLADKPGYAPGETARLQVRMPYRQATALVAVEREGVIDTRVVRLAGDDPIVEVPIPAAGQAGASWAPNVYVSVLVVRGRVRAVPWTSLFSWGWREPREWWRAWRYEGGDYHAPTAMVDLGKPAHKFGVAQLRIGLDAHRLDVAVSTDKPQYAVRQTAKARIKVTQRGVPAAGAEIAFAAVDESLLALLPNSSWKLLEAMFEPRGWSVATATAQGEIIGRRHYGRKAVPAGGGGGRNPTRELFDTLLLWRGSVLLDARGEAAIDVPLNDSLTSFRLVALASAGADRFGAGSTTIRVTQDLQMLSGVPPLAREGDRFDAVFTLRNTTARAMSVRATLIATAHVDAGPGGAPPAIARETMAFAPQTVSLAPGTAAEVKWPVEVPGPRSGAFSIAYEAGAQEQAGNAPASDRLKVLQRIAAAHPLRVLQGALLQVDGSAAMPVAPPADALAVPGPVGATGAAPKAGGVVLHWQRSLAGELPGLRRFFDNYPFSCLEQQASRAIALHDSASWAALVNALPGYLDADGLANYYPPRAGDGSRGSDRLTAHLIAAAHEGAAALPAPLRERMLQGLAAFVEGRLQREFWSPAAARGIDFDVRKLAAIEALSRHDRATPKQLQSITLAPNRWPTAAVIDWLRILQRLDGVPERVQRIAEARAILRARVTYAGSTLKFSTEESDDWWWLMDSADANAARLILALVDDAAWKDEMPRLVAGALARQQRGAWRTTTANLWGALALERFAARFESQPVGGRSSAALGSAGAALDWASVTTAGAKAAPPLQLPWGAQGASLQLAHQGSGKPWVTVQALAAVPLAAPIAAGYRLMRSLSAVERKTEGGWTRGDIVRVRIEIEALADMTWVALNDPVPTGATLLGGGLARDSALAARGERREGSAWLAFEERAQDGFRASWEFMPRGRHSIEYTLRLNSAGRFTLPPTRVEAMYAPDSFGELPNAAIEVRP